jgi:hypothetical protein
VSGSLAALGSPSRSQAPHRGVVAAVESMGGIGAGEERAHLQGVGFLLGTIDKFSHKKVVG